MWMLRTFLQFASGIHVTFPVLEKAPRVSGLNQTCMQRVFVGESTSPFLIYSVAHDLGELNMPLL